MKIDRVIENADIVTMDAAHPRATRMGIWKGRVIGVDDELDGLDVSETVDLGGHCVIPGLIDGHTHNGITGLRMQSLDITGCATPDEALDKIRAESAATPEGASVPSLQLGTSSGPIVRRAVMTVSTVRCRGH